jgi:hypothetical protein
MGTEQDTSPQKIADMTDMEKLALMMLDPKGYYGRAYAEERPSAEQQVNHALERLRRLGQEGLVGSES